MTGRLIERNDIVDYQTYEDDRGARRSKVLETKRLRRIHVGKYLTFLFENRETLVYQVQEIMRAEQIVRETAIQHEIEVYNQMLGQPGELGCVLFIEIAEASDRKPLLKRWLGLESTVYVRLEDGSKVYAKYDPSQVGEDRLSAVQYLCFPVGGKTPMAIGTDFQDLAAEVELNTEQRAALAVDLAAS
ncbi:MAG: DUF3501 family protein [Actinomycetia bacterium]|nr:DUF3501 family protein [Actinomycetes bacterium]